MNSPLLHRPNTYTVFNGELNVLDYGAVGDGTTDDTTAIQAAIDAAAAQQHPPAVIFPPRTYKTTSTLTVVNDSMSLIGIGQVSSGNGSEYPGGAYTTRGATIRYHGTGTAVLIGTLNTAPYIHNIRMENLRIEVDNDTTCGLYVWQPANSYFARLAIFGNAGSGHVGMEVRASISCIFEMIDIHGAGNGGTQVPAEYLAIGLSLGLGYNNMTVTTTVFRRCYFHYCVYGVSATSTWDFEDCIFETCAIGFYSLSGVWATFTRCWWENNTQSFYFTGDTIYFYGCRFDSYAVQVFFGSSGILLRADFSNCYFYSSHATPKLWNTSNNIAAATGVMNFYSCEFAAATTLGGTGDASRCGYDMVGISNMARHIYRFVAEDVTGSATVNPVPTESGTTSYTFGQPGHLLGVNIYANSAVTSGSVDIDVKINGTGRSLMGSDIGAISTFPYLWKRFIFENKVVAGDVLTMYLHTTSIDGTYDFTLEVIVALGKDGVAAA